MTLPDGIHKGIICGQIKSIPPTLVEVEPDVIAITIVRDEVQPWMDKIFSEAVAAVAYDAPDIVLSVTVVVLAVDPAVTPAKSTPEEKKTLLKL